MVERTREGEIERGVGCRQSAGVGCAFGSTRKRKCSWKYVWKPSSGVTLTDEYRSYSGSTFEGREVHESSSASVQFAPPVSGLGCRPQLD